MDVPGPTMPSGSGSGRVGSGQELFEYYASGRSGHPDPIQPASSNPTREKPWNVILPEIWNQHLTLLVIPKHRCWRPAGPRDKQRYRPLPGWCAALSTSNN